MSQATLYYVHDPMCSWCWGFQKVWPKVKQSLKGVVEIEYRTGGLAPDSDEPMPQAMQNAISGYWKNIQEKIPGTEFNFNFWKDCTPRRSTYPACRAVLAAKLIDENKEYSMIQAIQHAYYLEAKNPSNIDTLIDCAQQIDLCAQIFTDMINSQEVNDLLIQQMSDAINMQAQGFPSLILENNDQFEFIFIDYNNADVMINQVQQHLCHE